MDIEGNKKGRKRKELKLEKRARGGKRGKGEAGGRRGRKRVNTLMER